MSNVKKIDLLRFKKTMSGLIDFAMLIEQATPARRSIIIAETQRIDPQFLKKAMKKVVYFEELVFLDEGILADILSKITPRQIAYAIKKMPTDFRKEILKHLSYVGMKHVLDEEDQLKKDIPDEFILGAQKQILFVARTLESQHRFVFELSDCPRFKRDFPVRRVRRGY